MTFGELLARITLHSRNVIDQDTFIAPYNALQAVVELHEPIRSIRGIVCRHCFADALNRDELYPCLTIQTIERELV